MAEVDFGVCPSCMPVYRLMLPVYFSQVCYKAMRGTSVPEGKHLCAYLNTGIARVGFISFVFHEPVRRLTIHMYSR
ncbi:hypothetical protein [Candidatus Anaplasma sp. TIGMIC]|uniref:hypothetical protein n=1 Tax=Candidatus Anaplasma sp. TIGMIC TaxID=3020713 RepID=UPI0023304842|nr:hypothetical protein [Candidatus Anaplasma sp. TIGMIC]